MEITKGISHLLAMASLGLMRDHLALDIPESLEIYEETTSGPDRKSSNNLRSLHRDLIWLHITKEEYGHLPGTVEHHPEDMEKHLGFKKIITIRSNLRHPWRHTTLSQHPLQAITATSWLISESRLYTSAPETSYLICFRPSTWHLAEAIKNCDINSWSRHEVGNHLQVINNSYDLDQDEIDSSRVFTIKGNLIQYIFGAFTWHQGFLWDYHIPYRASCLETSESIKYFSASIKDTAAHAGLYILEGLSSRASQDFVNACIQKGINMQAPQNDIKQRYRGHQEHCIYVLKNNQENIESYASKKEEHPSVPSYHLEDQDELMASGDVKHPCGSITHADGSVSIPMELIEPVDASKAS